MMTTAHYFNLAVHHNLTICLAQLALEGWTRVPHDGYRFERGGDRIDLVRDLGKTTWYRRPVVDVERPGLWKVERDRLKTAKTLFG